MKEWSDQDVATLKTLYCTTSATCPEIAAVLNRTKRAVAQKINKM